ncbi:multicopper oxidase family protein [Okeania sp. SIO1F9]|uniref:multicopper oxidase family protein n=1 Tax=Okeania sp. SIO1F9 TaxID=2607813 RepID=UPI00144BA700|nr:multicopper oxidase domain-containing protein [Okeania sp. SIO1F9]NET79092.1 multicopper oxidase domain-containing protein [Okeania sp. SIO1F9]
MFLVGTFTFVSTFTGEAFADGDGNVLIDQCSIITEQIGTQPEFENPTFAYTNNKDINSDGEITNRQGVILDAVQDKLYLDVDQSNKNGYEYDGYLYKTIFYDEPSGDRSETQPQKTIVRDTEQPAQINVVEYDASNPPNNMVGTYTPPTIVTSYGELPKDAYDVENAELNSFDLTLKNNLPVKVQEEGSIPQTKENLESQSQYTNIHYHGFNVSPLLSSDDVLVDVPSNVTPNTNPPDFLSPTPILPGGYYPGDNTYEPKYGGPINEYNMRIKIPYVHQSGLFWYHSHAHSLSRQQVRGGLSGGIIIKGMDDYYKLLNTEKGLKVTTGNLENIDTEPEPFSVNQKVMMFKDFNDILGTNNEKCLTLNGQVNPKITIKPGEVQFWRIANSGSDVYMNIALEQGKKVWKGDHYELGTPDNQVQFANPNGEPNFIILARDGDVVEKPVATDSVLLPPASRVELLVVGGKKSDYNGEYYLVSDLETHLTKTDKPFFNNFFKITQLLATVKVGDDEDSVCYKDKDGNNLELGDLCSGDNGKSLYRYLQQKSEYQDKILPPSKYIMPSDTLNACPDKYHHYAYRIDPETGKKIVYDEDVLYNGEANGENKRCITYPTEGDNDIKPMYTDPRTSKRYFYFSRGDGKFFLKGFEKAEEKPLDFNKIKELYDANRIDKVSRIGDLEEWYLVNADSNAHVFHIHQLDFVVTEVTVSENLNSKKYNNYDVENCTHLTGILPDGTDGYKCTLESQGYRDVINLPKNSVTTIRIPFVNPFITGTFVYHCHILLHEDRGMMNNIQVVNPDGFEISGAAPTK